MSWNWRDTSGAVGPGTGTVNSTIYNWRNAAINSAGTRIVGAARDDVGLWIGDLSNGSWIWRDTSGAVGPGTGTNVSRQWNGAAINSAGTRIVGAAELDIGLWIGDLSSNGSWTWRDTSGSNGAGTGINGSRLWADAAINAEGTRIVGAANADVGLWIGDLSSNGSWTWVNTNNSVGPGTGTSSGRGWGVPAINDAGTRIVGAAYNDVGLWIGDLSSNGSWTWRDTSGSVSTGTGTGTGATHGWTCAAINAAGTRIVGAANDDTGLWIGDLNSNGSWTWRDTSGAVGVGTGTDDGRGWSGVAINAEGTRIVGAAGNDVGLWIGDLNANGSWSWVNTNDEVESGTGTNDGRGWLVPAINADGTRIVGSALFDVGLWIGDYTPPSPQSSQPPPSLSYIIGPGRASSDFTRFQIGFNIQKPRSSQLDYEFRILQQMSAAQERRRD